MRFTAAILALTVLAAPAIADDGAASIAAGGLVLMKREPRITMAREVLRIARSKVVVDYEFRNDSDDDISTVVAFPVPPYKFGDEEGVFGDPGFDDFKLNIEGEPARFSIETRAFVGKRDITPLLAREHIDAASFGHWDTKEHDYSLPGRDFENASSAAQRRLIVARAYNEDKEPNWRVEKKYYWTQNFPARQTIHIEHTYTPVIGGTNSVRYGLEPQTEADKAEEKRIPELAVDRKYTDDEIKSLCLEPPLAARLLTLSRRNDMSVPFNYVDFILTTANTWKTPIEDFTLIVDRPAPDKSIVSTKPTHPRHNETLVSFCWAGPIEKTDANHFTAHATNFIPTKELRIAFIDVDQQDPGDD